MTAGTAPEPASGEPAGPRDNGLVAARYVPLTDIDAAAALGLLSALGRARIPAYLGFAPSGDSARKRLYVSAEDRADARTVVTAVLRGSDSGMPADASSPGVPPLTNPAPDGEIDVDIAFAEMIADWHVDTHRAIREAERELARQDENWRARLELPEDWEPTWLDEEHYVPPPPPPLPRLALPTALAACLLAASILLLVLGGMLGLATDFTMLLGVLGVLASSGLLVMRLRRRNDDDGDDGAML